MTPRHHLRVNDVSVVISDEPIEAIAKAGGLDALVSSDDTRLSMGGGVSGAIRIAGGEVIAQEARKLAPVRVGDVAVTSAGSLPAKYVLHAVTVDWDQPVRPSELTIRLAAENVLRRCELAHAHNANVLHGDIKPSNVFVDPAGRAAKLADFGIARAVGGTERNALVTKLIGTPRYMAPEQKTVGALIGPRTDLYLLARTLADFIGATVDKNGGIGLPNDESVAPAAAVLKRGLANEAAHRPTDAKEFGNLLQGALAATA